MIKRFTINHVERSYNGVFLTTEHGDLEHTTTLANNQASVVGFLDQTKAFDRVDWHWKDKCLQKFNFGYNFRKWTQMMFTGSKTADKNKRLCV